jgi:hypothetical protein
MTINNSLLKEKYKNVIKSILDMMSHPIIQMRPTCDQLLNDKSLWSLEISDIENDVICQELSKITINKISIEQNFFKYFLKTKLLYR